MGRKNICPNQEMSTKCDGKVCPSGKICNPKSGRCVKRDGRIGKEVLATQSGSRQATSQGKYRTTPKSQKDVEKNQTAPDMKFIESVKLGRATLKPSTKCLRGCHLAKIIGSGGYGVVSKGCTVDELKRSNCMYAVKLLPIRRTQSKKDILQEINLTKKFWEKYKIGPRFYGGWICEREKLGVIVTELWEGSFQDLLDMKKVPSDKQLMQLVEQIEMIHRDDHAHTDIQPKNVLYRGQEATLTDFGLVDDARMRSDPDWKEIIDDYHRSTQGTLLEEIQKRTGKTFKKLPWQIYDWVMIFQYIVVNPKYYSDTTKEVVMKNINHLVPGFLTT